MIKVKVSDLGLSRIMTATGALTPNVGTRGLRAPEVESGVCTSEYGLPSDVYSFGRLAGELASSWAAELVQRCTELDPGRRLTARGVLEWLRKYICAR